MSGEILIALRALVGAGAGLAVVLFMFGIVSISSTRQLRRMQQLIDLRLEAAERELLGAEDLLAAQIASRPFYQRILLPFWRQLLHVALRHAPTRILATLQRQLDAAGNPHRVAPHEMVVAKAAGAVIGAAAGTVLTGMVELDGNAARWLLVVALATLAGWFLPDAWLYQQRQRHLRSIATSLPDVIDLLCVGMEGGLSYDGSVAYVVAKMESATTHELHRYMIDRQVGRGPAEAMRAMGNRTREPDLMRFVEVVVQAEELGTGVNRVLHAFSSDLRTKRRQRAEKKAHEASMKMLFPMILLIFPAIFVIILGPTVPIFMKSFLVK